MPSDELRAAREALERCEVALLRGIGMCDGPMEAHADARREMHEARGAALNALDVLASPSPDASNPLVEALHDAHHAMQSVAGRLRLRGDEGNAPDADVLSRSSAQARAALAALRNDDEQEER